MLFRRYKPTPRVIQMEAVECGAASLSILLQYHKKYLPLEEIRLDCGVSRDGSNAFNLIQAAGKYGLVGKGKRSTAEELRSVKGPVILFWEYNHFLVLEGFKRNRVYLNDPAVGRRHIPFEEFKKRYSGICLSFEKTTNFVPGGKPPSFVGDVWNILKKSPKGMSFLIFSGLLLLLPGFAMPAFLMAFINTFFSQNVISWRWDFLGVVFITFAFSGCLNWMRKFFINRFGAHLSLVLSGNFLWHLLKLPVSFYNQRYSGEIAYRQSLNNQVAQTLSNTLLSAFIDVFLIIFYALLMFVYDSAIAWVGLAAGFLSFVTLGIIYKSRENVYACLQQQTGKEVSKSISGLQNIETIKAKGAESDFFSTWAGTYTNAFNDRQEIGKKDVILNTMPSLFHLLATMVLLGLGSLRVIDGTLSVGMLMAMQVLQTNFLEPILRFVGFNQLIQSMKVDMDRLKDVLKNPTCPIYEEKREKKHLTKGCLEFKNVTFSYAPFAPPSIEDISFTVNPGERIALVGPTGSGKSTIAKLSNRLLTPSSGEILLDGEKIDQIAREDLYNFMASVDQEIFLFSGTIRDNITLWNSALPDDVLIHAAKDANIHEEILLREGNYNSSLTEGGRNLSGGQRQRIEIARALLYNPPLLILDEAMSALDSKLEKDILDRIALRGCSVLVISHRLSTIQECHKIVVLDQGKVVQEGTHEELKNVPGVYQELVHSETVQCIL